MKCFSQSGWWQTLCGLDAANQGFGWTTEPMHVGCPECLDEISRGEHLAWDSRHFLKYMRKGVNTDTNTNTNKPSEQTAQYSTSNEPRVVIQQENNMKYRLTEVFNAEVIESDYASASEAVNAYTSETKNTGDMQVRVRNGGFHFQFAKDGLHYKTISLSHQDNYYATDAAIAVVDALSESSDSLTSMAEGSSSSYVHVDVGADGIARVGRVVIADLKTRLSKDSIRTFYDENGDEVVVVLSVDPTVVVWRVE